MDSIKVYTNNNARTIIKGIMGNVNSDDKQYIKQWLNDVIIKCYCYFYENKIVSFALLSKCDYDPLNEYSNPYILNYIYTFEQYRRKSFVSSILDKVKKSETVTAFCSNDISEKLLEKNGFSYIDGICCYRYP